MGISQKVHPVLENVTRFEMGEIEVARFLEHPRINRLRVRIPPGTCPMRGRIPVSVDPQICSVGSLPPELLGAR